MTHQVDKRQEDEANAFAVALLVPEGRIRADVESMNSPLKEKDVRSLATRYRVNRQLMTLRLLDLKITLDPAGD